MIGLYRDRRHGSTRGTRLDALIVGVVVAALGAIIKSLLTHRWGDEETASGAAVRPMWTVVGGGIVIVIGVAVLLIKWRSGQENR